MNKVGAVGGVNNNNNNSSKVADKNGYVSLMRQTSLGKDEETASSSKRQMALHRNSWPGNHEPVSPRGPMKSHMAKVKEDETKNEETSSDSDALSYTETNTDIPTAEVQRKIINEASNECTHTYAVSKVWFRKWEEYVGIARCLNGDNSSGPGPIEMDVSVDTNNDYIHEDVWKRFISWYGVSSSHQLDRKHMYFKDEKVFDICILSPFSGIVEHGVKKFNRFEEIGYIECQLRKIFRVPDYKKTRLWISEKAQVPRFRQLPIRSRMLNDCIHRDKVYILALEASSSQYGWPTGEPGETKGELSKYADIVGRNLNGSWNENVRNLVDDLEKSVCTSMRVAAEEFFQNGQNMMQEQQQQLNKRLKRVDDRQSEVDARERAQKDKLEELNKKEEILREEQRTLVIDKDELKENERKFHEEMEKMKQLHKIQETKIKLDVGGKLFSTSIQTLTRVPDSLLATMFSGRHPLKTDSDDSYFIDRDGSYFRHILNFLRDGAIETDTLPQDKAALREILREAKYYQLYELAERLKELCSKPVINGLEK